MLNYPNIVKMVTSSLAMERRIKPIFTSVAVVPRTPWQKERVRTERLRTMVHRALHHGDALDLPLMASILNEKASIADLEIQLDTEMLVEDYDLEDDYFEDEVQKVG